MTVQQIAARIRHAQPDHSPIIIGVEGYGGSVKTTFAEQLAIELGNAYVINFDDFIIKEKISNADKSGFDKKRLEKQVLIPARNNLPIRYQRLIWAENKLSEPLPVLAADYLIIEGISCYHPSIAHYYDYKIWVDTPMHIAKQRGVQRDRELGSDNDKLWDKWAETDLQYQSKHHPELMADFVYSNYDKNEA